MKKNWKYLCERVENAHKLSIETQKAAILECSRAWSLKEIRRPNVKVAQHQYSAVWSQTEELRFVVEKVQQKLVSKIMGYVTIDGVLKEREINIGELVMEDLTYLVPMIQTVKDYTEGLIDELPPSNWFPTDKTSEDK